MKTQILTCLLKKVKATTTSEEFRKVEDIIINMASVSPDPRVRAAAKATRLVLDVKHQKQKQED